jgi:glycine cleavage system transcriptional repressor
MSTQKYQSTHTGAGMVSVQMVLHVPVNQHPQALRESFMDLCDDLNADGMLDPIKS